MQQESHVINYAAAHPDVPSISAQKALLTCLPGLLALLTYVAYQYRDLPPVLGYLFWPSLAIGLLTSAACFVRFRRTYRGRARPWLVSVSIAVHAIVLLVGIAFLLFFVVIAISASPP